MIPKNCLKASSVICMTRLKKKALSWSAGSTMKLIELRIFCTPPCSPCSALSLKNAAYCARANISDRRQSLCPALPVPSMAVVKATAAWRRLARRLFCESHPLTRNGGCWISFSSYGFAQHKAIQPLFIWKSWRWRTTARTTDTGCIRKRALGLVS